MQSTLLRASFSPIVREGLDASASLFTINAETLAQAVAIPIHLSTMIPVLQRIIQEFPVSTMKEGDLYLMNAPYLGGTHIPDIGIVMPIFAAGTDRKSVVSGKSVSVGVTLGGRRNIKQTTKKR